MAIAKNSRVEGRKSLNFHSTVSIAVLVAFCFICAWMAMSFIAPLQNSELKVSQTINEVKHIVGDNASKQFESENYLRNQEGHKGIGELYDNTSVENRLDDTMRKRSDEKKDSDRNLNSESAETETLGVQTIVEKNLDENDSNNKLGAETSTGNNERQDEIDSETVEDEIKKNRHSKVKEGADEIDMGSRDSSQTSKEAFDADTKSGILNNATAESGTWSTQTVETLHDKETQKSLILNDNNKYEWKLCKTTAGPEYIPCLDNWQTIRRLPSISHYEHWERHCPDKALTCLVPLPEGYRIPIKWPRSREMVSGMYWMKITYCYLMLKSFLAPIADMVQECTTHKAC